MSGHIPSSLFAITSRKTITDARLRHDPKGNVNDMTLAIVAPNFNQVSETFVIDHVRTLAPDNTVLVCDSGVGAESFGYPVLSHVKPELSGTGALDVRAKKILTVLRNRLGPALALDNRMRVMAFFREHEVSVVLGEFGHSGAMMAEVCRDLGIPLYAFFRGNDASSMMRHAPVRRQYRRMFSMASGIFCVSRYIADRIVAIGCPRELIHIMTDGVLLDRFVPGTPEPGRLLAVGRLVEKKAPDLTLQAFARVAATFPHAHLDMVGDGPLASRCRAVIAEHGLQDRVTLHGALGHQDVHALMQRADMFVQHSVTAKNGDAEGFPTVIAEAMASSVPVISTRHSGIPEHVRSGETGLLVEEHDVAGMAEAIAALLSAPERSRTLGTNARNHAEKHLDRTQLLHNLRAVLKLPEPKAASQRRGGAPS